MISAYSPVLKNYSELSPEWYKKFHSIFYMSQLTNQLLLSYLERKIDDDKNDMVDCMLPELIDSKVVRNDPSTNSIIISKPDELKSLHIRDTIDLIVENVFKNNHDHIRACLAGMQLEVTGYESKDVNINPDSLLDLTASKNWFELLKGLLNVWEFIFLYGAVESALKEILSLEGQVREEELVTKAIDEIDGGLHKENFDRIWRFYTELRNIYVHNHGLINSRIKSNLGGKLEKLKHAVFDLYDEQIMLIDLEDVLKKSKVENGKFYFMQDLELNVFRNSVIDLMEALDKLHVENFTEV